MNRLLSVLALVSLGWAPFGQPGAGQAGDTLTLSVQASGTVNVAKRESDNYSQAVERWTVAMTFSQPTQFKMIRPKPGRIGGAPAGLFDFMVASGEDLFQPVPSPLDSITQDLTGEIKVSACGRSEVRFPIKKGMKTPDRIKDMIAIPLESLGMVDKGTFYVQGCSTNPDQVLVFYLPPPGFYSTPKRGPIKCNEDYTYEQDEGDGLAYESSLLEESYATEAKAVCPGYAGSGTEPFAFVGSASWRALAGGTTVTLNKSYHAIDGQEGNQAEPFTSINLALTVILHKM